MMDTVIKNHTIDQMDKHILVGKSHDGLCKGLVSMLDCYKGVSEHTDKGYLEDKEKKEKKKVQSRNRSCHRVGRKGLL